MATYNFLDKTGLGLVWAKIKGLIPTKTSDLTNDSGFITSASVTPEEIFETTATEAESGLYTFDPPLSSFRNGSYKMVIVNHGGIKYYCSQTDDLEYYFTAQRSHEASIEWIAVETANGEDEYYIYEYVISNVFSKYQGYENAGKYLAVASNGNVEPVTVAIPTKTSDLTNDAGYLTSYTETDPVFSASAAAGITSTDISNWNAKVSDDKTWNGVRLEKSSTASANNYYVPVLSATSGTTAYLYTATKTPTSNAIAKYDGDKYLISTTTASTDSSTKVATTAFVKAQGYLTLDDLPIYDGTVTTGGGS